MTTTAETPAIQKLVRENAELRGEILATGVILTQLLQAICRTQMNPSAYAGRIMKDAREAVTAFDPPGPADLAAESKARALQTVQHYEDQIRAVLPV